ncbi:MAG: tetratricopeptide repeat protein [Spirochaetes bacterium]|nr:tetratricopeptide repeat protein [Spirochaetota bacterium]
MGRFLVHAAAAAAMVLVSCYSYQAVPVERAYSAGGRDPVVYRMPADRYVARILTHSPVSAINSRAIDLCLRGRFEEAEILFREVVAEAPAESAGYNNLGVACEINGRRDEAFARYATACRLLPGDIRFKKNFSLFADYRSGGK